MRQPTILMAFLAALGATACHGEPEKPKVEPEVKTHGLSVAEASEPLVKLGSQMITVGDFAERLAEKSPYLRARYNSPERRREFLDELVKLELLAMEAERQGLLKSPAVQRTRAQVMVQQMMKAEFEDKVRLSDITEEEIKAYYDAHPDEFHKPEQVRASHILLTNAKAAAGVLAKVVAAKDDNSLFRRLARERSEDGSTAARGGDLQFFSRVKDRLADEPEVPAAVVEAAFGLQKIGAVHPTLVKSPAGLHIVKLTGRRRALSRSLDHARRPIQNRLWRQKRDSAIEQFVNGLRKRAKVEEHFERLQAVKLPEVGAGLGRPLLPTE